MCNKVVPSQKQNLRNEVRCMNEYYYSEFGWRVTEPLITESTYLFLENSSPAVQESVFSKIVKKIKELFRKAREWFANAFSNKKIEELEAKVEANPELKNKKIKVKDRTKLEKLNDETLSAIDSCNTEAEVDAVMQKHKSKKKKIIAAIAVTAITVAGAIVFLKKHKGKVSKKLTEHEKKLEETVEEARSALSDMTVAPMDKTPKVKTSPKSTSMKTQEPSASKYKVADKTPKLAVKKANASMEVVKESINEQKEAVEEITTSVVLQGGKTLKVKSGRSSSGFFSGFFSGFDDVENHINASLIDLRKMVDDGDVKEAQKKYYKEIRPLISKVKPGYVRNADKDVLSMIKLDKLERSGPTKMRDDVRENRRKKILDPLFSLNDEAKKGINYDNFSVEDTKRRKR